MMNVDKKRNKFLYGTTTIGEKGQVVIPIEVRQVMDLKKSDKLLVFGMDRDILAFAKLSHLEKLASHLSDHLERIRRIIKKTNSK